ncbi:MAG: hypothetical protein L0211_04490 [Planctomycetaceae bacterium]|nr:hypothetical protein [Planctomycetaceae bacterium]
MPLSRGERRWAWVGAVVLAAALAAGLYFSWCRLRDRQVAGEAEAEVVRTLTSLPADHPITRRYGRFQRLEGAGFERSAGRLGLPTIPISIERRAVFDHAWSKLFISVKPGERLATTHLAMKPSEAEAAGLERTLQNGEIRFAGWQYGCGLWVEVSHPSCPRK